ncbi:MAG: hypothetical protein JWN56_2877 [Sphingobacteriales bacterium]|nr:hypothetical protein [Sphingobacteriales bacterium]
MTSILITGASDAKAYRLQQYVKGDIIIFADHQDLPQLPSSSRKFIKIPQGDAPTYAHELLSVCLDHQVSKVYPLHKTEVFALSEAAILFAEYGITLVIPDQQWLNQYAGDSTYDTSNVIVLEDNKITGGNFPAELPIPQEQMNGIFNFTFHNDEIKLTLFTI